MSDQEEATIVVLRTFDAKKVEVCIPQACQRQALVPLENLYEGFLRERIAGILWRTLFHVVLTLPSCLFFSEPALIYTMSFPLNFHNATHNFNNKIDQNEHVGFLKRPERRHFGTS